MDKRAATREEAYQLSTASAAETPATSRRKVKESFRLWRGAVQRCVPMLALIYLLLCGCAAKSELLGYSEPDVTQIHAGDPRHRVERTLGGRLWRAGSADELTYDIYQFKAHRPARPLLGAFLVALDYGTAGIAELYIHNDSERDDAAPVRQVAVAFDETDRVRFVSQPWYVTGYGPCRRMRSVLPADSGVPPSTHPAPISGRAISAFDVAHLEIDWGMSANIDGRKPERRTLDLPPGTHAVTSSEGPNTIASDIEFLPGRRYRLKYEHMLTQLLKELETDFLWIEDADSGEVLRCTSATESFAR
jgi:hypothetical protein